MYKVGQLIEILSQYPYDMDVTNEQNLGINHVSKTQDNSIILSYCKPIGTCNRSGGEVYPSVVDGYDGYSVELDEDLYKHEFTRF